MSDKYKTICINLGFVIFTVFLIQIAEASETGKFNLSECIFELAFFTVLVCVVALIRYFLR